MVDPHTIRFFRPGVRWMLFGVGLLYAFPFLVLGLAVVAMSESVGLSDEAARVVGLGAAAVSTVIAACLGLRVQVAATPTGIQVANRWRSRHIAWADVRRVRRGSSVAYQLMDVAQSIVATADDDPLPGEYLDVPSSVLIVETGPASSDGRTHSLRCLATLRTRDDDPALMLLIDAVRQAGVPVELDADRSRPEEGAGTRD